MRRQLAILAAIGLVIALGSSGTMAQTPYGSSSQSAPAGLDHNPSAEMGRTPGHAAVKRTKTLKQTHRLRGAQTTGSSSQSAPPGMDYNPAAGSR
jgi:hypothetical protein